MSISLSVFLIVYLVFAALGLLFLFFNVFQVYRFGVAGTHTNILLILYPALYIALIVISGIFLVQVDWSQSLNIGEMQVINGVNVLSL